MGRIPDNDIERIKQATDLMDKVSFPEAVKRLNGHQRDAVVGTPALNKKSSSLAAKRPSAPVVNAAQRVKLLTRVATFYQKTFTNRQESLKYLVKQRGISNVTHFKNYPIGYAESSLLEALPQDADSLNLF